MEGGEVGFFRFLVFVTVLTASAMGSAQDLSERLTEATLDNGLRVILVENPVAPVIAFNLTFAVGGVDEPHGLGGIAHMVEHMAFKGTTTIGSFDAEAEARALVRLEVAARALAWAIEHGSPQELAEAQAHFAFVREEAQALGHPAPIDELLSSAGAVGLNAWTGYDETSYVVELPANRLELYARIYADVLLDPTYRYFYEERDVVRQERRQRNEDDPQGFLFEAFLAEAFSDRGYGRSLIGSAETIESYTATEARAFLDHFYGPEDAVLVLVGDVDPARDLPIIERYFGAVPRRGDRLAVPAPRVDQDRERRVTVTYEAQPQLAMGWHKATYPERDAFVLDLISALLSSGRTSRLYERLVLEEASALDVTTSSSFPGIRYSNLFLVYAQPRSPHGPDDLEEAVLDELDRLASEPVPPEELDKVKNLVRASTVRSLASNRGLAASLAFHELFAGGWQRLFDDLEVYDDITPEEVMRVARETFVAERRTVAVLLPGQGPEAAR
jgi:predicted Zn-dependent peptidase